MSKQRSDMRRLRVSLSRRTGTRCLAALVVFNLALIVLILSSNGGPETHAGLQTLAFTHVTVIDATGAPQKDDMTVVIEGDRIIQLGSSRSVTVPKGARVVNAEGKFLIPGLWDMHAHITYGHFLKLHVANGVTGLREMGGSAEEFAAVREQRNRIANGELLGPRIVTAGLVVDGPRQMSRPNSLYVTSDREAREAVDSLKKLGADFVKVYSMLPREGYFAIADEAKRQGLPFAGHLPASVSAAEGSDAGQKSMEHLFGVIAGCSSKEAQLTAASKAVVEKSGISGFVTAEIDAQLKALDTYDESKAGALFARFAGNGTWQVPTLTGWKNLGTADDGQLTNDARNKYIPRERREAWKVQREGLRKSLPSQFFQSRLIEKQRDVVRAMQRAGVGILTGTDSAGLYLYPGFSLHQELALLVEAGLSPMEALQAATRNPAKCLGLLERVGTVEKGKLADLVLLEANPLLSINNTQRIAAVVVGGRLISKPELEQLLNEAQAEANPGDKDRQSSVKRSDPMVALLGATVIDGNGGAPVRDAAVLIEDGRIAWVGSRSRAKYPKDAKVIDLSGKFIIPGLIDLHVHYSGWMGELFLAHGVTTVKDMGNDVEWISTISAETDQGKARGPRIFYVGNAIDLPPPERDHHIGLDDAALAKRAVTLLHSRGVCAIKAREKASPEIIKALTSQAHRLGLIVTGHLGQTNARDAALAGIDGLEHASGIVEATADGPRSPKPAGDLEKAIWEIKSYSLINPAKAEELVRFLSHRKVALIPTMSNWWRMATARRDVFAGEDAEYAKNPLLSYVPEQIRNIWVTSAFFKVQDAADQAQIDLGYKKVQDLLIKHYRAGGRLLAGTDTLVSIPGLSLQRELMFLLDAGLTRAQVISIATRDNARFLGKGKELGTISAGKLADLVVLSANPLDDISNLRRVAMVMKGGRMVDTTYHPDYAVPTPKPTLTRPLWIERQLKLHESGKAAKH